MSAEGPPASSASPGKYVPRFKRDANAIPSALALYDLQDIQRVIPGGHHHTFVRALAAADELVDPVSQDHQPLAEADGTNVDKEAQRHADETPEHVSNEFCRVMIHKFAHLSPPRELWTRNNIDLIEENIGRQLPVFQEVKGRQFEYLGWYRITKWDVSSGKSSQVRRFIEKRKVSQRERTPEYWAKALSEDWARVELERVTDSSLKDPMLENVQRP